jgi:hypothetical protein
MNQKPTRDSSQIPYHTDLSDSARGASTHSPSRTFSGKIPGRAVIAENAVLLHVHDPTRRSLDTRCKAIVECGWACGNWHGIPVTV